MQHRDIDLHSQWVEISDFEDGEFYGFRIDCEQGGAQSDLQNEVDIDEFTFLTYGGETEEWEEANARQEARYEN